MDQPTSSPESTGGRSPSGSPPPAGQRQQGALGGRQVSEAPSQAPSIRDSRAAGTATGVKAFQPVPTRARLGSTPGITGLPWLTREQNEERQVLHSRLSAWRERPQAASQPRADVDEALGLVSRIERDLVRADELLQGMRTRLLTEAEWRELTFLVEQARADTPRRLARATDRLDGLADIGPRAPQRPGNSRTRCNGSLPHTNS